MKSKEELLKMLYSRLTELEDGRIKNADKEYAMIMAAELGLLSDILGDEVAEEYWERIDNERYWYIDNGMEC